MTAVPPRQLMRAIARYSCTLALLVILCAVVAPPATALAGAHARELAKTPANPGAEGAPCTPRLQYYGTYSVGTRFGNAIVPLADRLRELRDLGANMIVATGKKTAILDLLPDGLLAVPGCGLMQREDWQAAGKWDEKRARTRLAALAAKFANHPRVYGVCLTHEVSEYADHERRHWMYRLAKEYFPQKKVIHYYGYLWDQENPQRHKVDGYGDRGEIETDILFVSLPATKDGRFAPDNVRRLEDSLAAAQRTPGIPVWGQTSINADHRYVTGPESMATVWGPHGENITHWSDLLTHAEQRDRDGRALRLSGFFWRSLGRFPYDLGYPAFVDHRARVRAIAKELCLGHAEAF